MDARVLDFVDKAEIVELVSRYCLAVDNGDADAFADCFAEGAVYCEPESLGGTEWTGRKALKAIAMASSTFFPGVHHRVCNHVVELKGDKAHCTSELLSVIQTPDGVLPFSKGFFEDDFVKINGKWLFLRKSVRGGDMSEIDEETEKNLEKLHEYIREQSK